MSPSGGGPAPERGFVETWRVLLRRRWRWGLGAAVAVLAVVLGVLLLSSSVYRGEARLRLGDPPPMGGVSPNAGLLSFFRPGGDPFANDLELLDSRSLAEDVVREAALSVSLRGPRGWTRDSVLTSLAVGDSTVEATYEVTWTEPGAVRVRRTAPSDSTVAEGPAGTPLEFGGLRAVFREMPPRGPGSVDLKTLPFGEAVRRTRSRLTAERTRRDANVVEITYDLDDPGVALHVVQATVGHFLRRRAELFRRESGQTVDSLRTVLDSTWRELAAAEDSLEALQQRTGLVAADAQSEALVERYETALAALEAARAEQQDLDAGMERVAAARDRLDAWSALMAHPRFLANETMGELLRRLTLLEEERIELASLRTPASRAVRTVEAQITGLDQALRELVEEYRQGLEGRIRDLESRLAVLDAELSTIPARVVALGRRERQVRILSEVLVLTEQRLRQEELRQALSYATVQVLDPPALQYRPVWPRKKLGAAVGLLLALGTGLLAVVVVEKADGTVRRAEEIRRIAGAPVLATPVAAGGGGLTDLRPGTLEAADGEGPYSLVALSGAEDVAELAAHALGGDTTVAGRGLEGASSALEIGRPVVLLVAVGRTPARELERIAAYLEDGGGMVAGTVVVCRSRVDAAGAWG